MLNRKYKAIIFLVLLIAISYPYVLSQTPPGPNTMEHGQGINTPTVTTEYYYLGATNLTDRLLGDWDVALTSPTLDTGQGANELYDMDQNVLTTSDVEFNSVDATEFYLNSENITEHLEGNFTDSGIDTSWINATEYYLNDVNITEDMIDDLIAVSKNSGATIGTRQRINFIEGANVTLNIADDAGNDEIDVTITAATGGAYYGLNQSEASYIIYQSGGVNYLINCNGGTLEASSSDADEIFQWAEGNATVTGGTIHVKYATYSFDEGFTHYKDVCLIGDLSLPKLDVTGNLATALIEIDNSEGGSYRSYAISNFRIDMNNFNGHAIYGGRVCAPSMLGTTTFENLNIGYVKSGYAGMYLKDPFRIDMNQIKVSSQGYGIWFAHSGTMDVHYGNSYLRNILLGFNGGENAIGFYVDGTQDNYRPLNLVEIHRLQVGGGAAAPAGTTAVKIDFTGCTQYFSTLSFYDLNIEGAICGVNITNAAAISFYNPYVDVLDDNCYGFSLHGANTKHIRMYGGEINVGTNGIAINDVSTSGTYPNIFYGPQLFQGDQVVLSNSYLVDSDVSGYRNYNIGTSYIPDTETTATFNHLLYDTPDHVSITWTEDIGDKRFWYSATTTQITVTIDAPASQNYSFTWEARIEIP